MFNRGEKSVRKQHKPRKFLTDRIIVVLFILSEAVIKKTQVPERLKVAKAALQWLVIDPNGSSKLYNEREVMGS